MRRPSNQDMWLGFDLAAFEGLFLERSSEKSATVNGEERCRVLWRETLTTDVAKVSNDTPTYQTAQHVLTPKVCSRLCMISVKTDIPNVVVPGTQLWAQKLERLLTSCLEGSFNQVVCVREVKGI